MDNQDSYDDWFSLFIALIVVGGLMIFVFFSGTWYAESHQRVVSPISLGVNK